MASARRAVSKGPEAAWAVAFKAMGGPTRLSILLQLIQGEQCVTDIAKALKKNGSGVSFHLATLRRAGLVVAERQGQRVIYRITPELLKDAGDALVLDMGGCVLTFPKG